MNATHDLQMLWKTIEDRDAEITALRAENAELNKQHDIMRELMEQNMARCAGIEAENATMRAALERISSNTICDSELWEWDIVMGEVIAIARRAIGGEE